MTWTNAVKYFSTYQLKVEYLWIRKRISFMDVYAHMYIPSLFLFIINFPQL